MLETTGNCMKLLMMVTAVIAALTIAAAKDGAVGGNVPARVLNLERVLPLNHKVELEKLIARDRARHAQILQNFAGGVVDFPVIGSSDQFLFGLYYTKVKLGSPPREYDVQIDTGSDILWVTCRSCNNCPQTSGLGVELNFYDTAISSTSSLISCSDPMCASTECSSETNQCAYTFRYGDGSGTTGYYVSDLLYFDTFVATSLIANSSAPIVFGCSTSQSGDLTQMDRAIDGIFGFGPQDLSVISQLSARGISPKVFSHCLKGEGNGGGILVLGEILNPSIVYSPLVPSQGHYNVYIQSIAVNGQTLPVDPAVFASSGDRGTIVDSGTTLAYLTAEAYEPFVNAITAAVSPSARLVISGRKPCYLVSSSISDMFPPVSLNFAGGASMDLRPSDYLVHMGFYEGAAMWCIGFQRDDAGVTILGDLVLKDKIIVYDLARKRIGWADYDCSSPVNVSTTSGKDEFINAGQLSVSSSSSRVYFNLRHARTNARRLLFLVLMIGFPFCSLTSVLSCYFFLNI
ncbi:aspartic proteinase 36 isoform X1 [Nicotiana tabacum]|uniref:Aspartic proteinase 36 isoform X1 n=1 Tax=Nicotiana tabacum TaxID=4097 RepID=A0A1S4C1I7_TOBAC|nr:PREDICTED: aspartic proteinase-like protein 2 [Nicotiana tabacum]